MYSLLRPQRQAKTKICIRVPVSRKIFKKKKKKRCGFLVEKGHLGSQHVLQLRKLLKELMEMASLLLLQVSFLSGFPFVFSFHHLLGLFDCRSSTGGYIIHVSLLLGLERFVLIANCNFYFGNRRFSLRSFSAL